MGMFLTLRQVSTAQLDELIRDPSGINFFLYGAEEQKDDPSPGLLEKPTDETILELDKNWDILHFAFCLSSEGGSLPQSTLMAGGVEIGDVDVGYGPARALTTNDLVPFLEFLDKLTPETFASEVTSEKIKDSDIYFDAQWWGEEVKENLWVYVIELRRFIRVAVEKNNGIVAYLC